MAARFSPALLLWCTFGFCVIKRAVLTVYLQFADIKVVKDEEEVAVKKMSLPVSAKWKYVIWDITTHI